MKNLKKFFGMFLALCMVVGTLTTAYADDGSIDAPWQLSTTSVRFYVYVAPGETQWVQVDDCNGTTVEVGYATNTDYMINYGRLNTYYPENADGQLSFTMQPGGDMFSVYNSGEDYVSVYMSLVAGAAVDTTGTVDDPEELVLMANWFGDLAASVEKSFETGADAYFYYVTAPSDGMLSISTWGAWDEEYNNVGWMYNVNSMEARVDGTYYYGDSHWSDEEEPVMYEEIRVSEGEKYIICISTYNENDPYAYGAVAGTMSLNIAFAPVGSSGCPNEVETGLSEYEIEEDTQGYYVNWTAKEAGSVIVSVSGENGWQFSVNGEMADGSYYYGDTYTSNDEVVVSSESVPVNKGDIITIYVNTLMNEETWTCPAGKVTLDIKFVTAEEEAEVTVTEEELDAIADGSTFEGLDANKEIVFTPSYGQNVVDIKELEATTLKDVAYTALDINLLVHGDWGDYYADFAEDEEANLIVAIGEILDEAETVDVYTYVNGELTKLTTCAVSEGNIEIAVSQAATYVFVDSTVEEEETTSKEEETTSKEEETTSKEEETTTKNDANSENETTAGNTTGATPNTGDSSNVSMMLVLAAVAVVGALVVMNAKRREEA